MKREAEELLALAKEIMAAYPDSAPTEQERKKWREQAEERRRKDGVKPRKASADSDFKANAKTAKELLKSILRQIDRDEVAQEDSPNDYTYAAEMAKVVQELRGVLTLMRGQG